MSRFRTFLLAFAAVAVGACSDTQSPSTPADNTDELTLVLDESADMVAVEEEAEGADVSRALPATAGRGKNTANPQAIVCVRKRFHVLCLDVRSSRLRGADADAIVTKFKNRTRAVLRVNGFIVARSGLFGPNFVGDEIFANYRNLNYRVFRGDRVCSQFPGATAQLCGVLR